MLALLICAGLSVQTIGAFDIPKITVDYDGENRQIVHYCEFTPDNHWFWYRVEWSLLFGSSKDRLLHQTPYLRYDPSTFRKATVLTQNHLKNNGVLHVGYTIICAVRPSEDATHNFNKPMESPAKFCGFEVEPKRPLTIKPFEHNYIRVRITVPFSDNKVDKRPLVVLLYNAHKSQHCNSPTIESEVLPCGTRIDDVGVWQNISVRITPDDILTQQSPNYGVFLRSESTYDTFFEAELPLIRVAAEPSNNPLSKQLCYVRSPADVQTFDRRMFRVNEEGVFTLYQNPRYRLEIQLRLGKCPTWATDPNKPYCVGAVAIASGRDVFIVDIETAQIGFRLCEDGVLHRMIRRFGEKAFEIHLPTGTRINIENRSFRDFLDIETYPSLSDWTQCGGLCGNFDGDGRNDADVSEMYPNLIAEKSLARFRVTMNSTNLFNKESDNSLNPWYNSLKMCNCDTSYENIASGGLFNTIIDCNEETRNDCLEGRQGGLLRCDLELE